MKVRIPMAYKQFTAMYPGIQTRLPYSFEPCDQGTSYQIITCNYHHVSPKLMTKEYSMGLTETYRIYTQGITEGQGLSFKGHRDSLAQMDSLVTLYQSLQVLSSRRVLQGDCLKFQELHAGPKAHRSPDPLTTVTSLLLITGILLDLKPTVEHKDRYTPPVPPYYQWFKDQTHNLLTWSSMNSGVPPLSHGSQTPGWAQLYLQALRWFEQDVRIRRSLVNHCNSGLRPDNPLEMQFLCVCPYPCIMEGHVIVDLSRRAPVIHIPRNLDLTQVNQYLGLTEDQEGYKTIHDQCVALIHRGPHWYTLYFNHWSPVN